MPPVLIDPVPHQKETLMFVLHMSFLLFADTTVFISGDTSQGKWPKKVEWVTCGCPQVNGILVKVSSPLLLFPF